VNRALAWTVVAFTAGLSPAGAAVVAAPFSAAPLAAPAFSAASISAPALSSPAPLAASALAPSLAAAPLLAAPNLLPVVASPAIAPAAAPALPALRAAAAPDEPGDPKSPNAPKSPESQSAEAAARFDGAAASPAPVAAPAAPALGSGLRVADDADEPWLADLVGTLKRSKTGRRVLRDIDALSAKRGHPTLVVVKRIANNGEFRYDSDIVVMDSAHRRRDPAQTAPIFAHELQHVLQRADGLPADALELEIESYTVENRVWSELGVEPEPKTFARMARARLLRDTDEFISWLGDQYKNNHVLHGETDRAYANWLSGQGERIERRVKRAEKELRAAKRVAERMRAEGKPEAAVKNFIQDDVESVERRLRDLAAERAWNLRDQELMKDPAARARFRAYSRGVIRRARALSRS
jgi:hypothetical protein